MYTRACMGLRVRLKIAMHCKWRGETNVTRSNRRHQMVGAVRKAAGILESYLHTTPTPCASRHTPLDKLTFPNCCLETKCFALSRTPWRKLLVCSIPDPRQKTNILANTLEPQSKLPPTTS
jgi:hypothetical protein